MKRLVQAVAACAAVLALTAAVHGAAPPDGSPREAPTDPGTDAPNAREPLAPLEAFPCPAEAFDAHHPSGPTMWHRNESPNPEGDCIAQWGDGTFQSGSEGLLTSPGQPTGHLAASDAPGQALGNVAHTLVENGASPEVAARIVGSMADGCRTYGDGMILPSTDHFVGGPFTMWLCRHMLSTTSMVLDVPESQVGIGALYLDVTHAYNFTEPDAGQQADAGGWVEVRASPDEPFERLDPVALYAPTRDGLGTVCRVTGPPTLAVDALTRKDLPGFLGGKSVRDRYQHVFEEDRSPYNIFNRYTREFPSPFSSLPASQQEWEEDCAGTIRALHGEEAWPSGPLHPYPGYIEGEGPGFVGTSGDDEPAFVRHLFDLSPYAGETLTVRFHATGGPGEGTVVGGWWIDDVNVRYEGPPADRSVRLEQPRDGASHPPGGTTDVTATVRNLGQTTAAPDRLEIRLGDNATTIRVPELAPFEEHRVTVSLPMPPPGAANATARLKGPPPASPVVDHAPEATAPDPYPPNDEDRAEIDVEVDDEVRLTVDDARLDNGTAQVDIRVVNEGNRPLDVPVAGSLVPVDRATGEPRESQRIDAGTLETVTVPHGVDANRNGVEDPTTTVDWTAELPRPGVWTLEATTSVDPSARGQTWVAHQTALGPTLETSLGRVLEGPFLELPRGGFDAEEAGRFAAEPRHPIEGPHTRFVPTGQASLATSGEELPDEWTPVETQLGQDTAPTENTRAPATLQGYHIRQHHVAIHSLGTDAGDQRSQLIDELIPQNEDQRVNLEFRHAADVDWSNEKGAKARAVVVPGGEIDLVEELRAMENRTENVTEELPPEAQIIVNQVNMGLFFDNVAQLVDSSPYNQFPQDVCSQSVVPIGAGYFERICGDGQVVEQLEWSCPVRCEFPEHVGSTYVRATSEALGEGLVLEWEDPTGWEEVEADVTSIVENTTSPDGAHEGFYVMFDLVTTSDVDEVIASARADAPGKDEKFFDSYNGTARAGWEDSVDPLWTVDDPKIVRESQDEPIETICLSHTESDWTASCAPWRTVPPSYMRGWRSLPAEAGVDAGWTYDLRGGDPDSPAPGAFVWEGGTGAVVETPQGVRTAIDEQDTDPYSVLSSPVVDLSGYETPVVELNTRWTDVEVGSVTGESESISNRCENMRDAPSGTVWTRTGWNVRARPVLEDGSLGEAETLRPMSGYDECSDVGDVPVLFNGTAVHRKPHSAQASVGYEILNTPGTFSVPSRASCKDAGNPDALQFCTQTTLQFGHAEPVFALPQPTWETVAFDLSEFQNQEVRLEVHAFGVNTGSFDSYGDPVPRGELRVDRFEVGEGAPPFDVDIHHEQRPFIAPDTEELFEIDVTNRGRQPVENLTVRRSIIGPDGCQATDPVVVESILRDPDTSETGLPPGKTATLQDYNLSWAVPDRVNQLYERRLAADTGTLDPSEPPELTPRREVVSGNATVFVSDPDDCPSDVSVDAEILNGDAQVSPGGETVLVVAHGGGAPTPSTVRVTATDAHGAESLPAYITPLPPSSEGLRKPAEGSVNVEVVQSALNDTGDGSVVRISAEAPDELAKVDLILPCTAGPDCQGGLVEIGSQGGFDAVIEGLAPGTYLGYVDIGGQDAPFPVQFTIEREPHPRADAAPVDNQVRLKGETQWRPSLQLDTGNASRVATVGDPFAVPVELTNDGNVPLLNVSVDAQLAPQNRTLQVEDPPLLRPGETATVNVTGQLETRGSAVLELRARGEGLGGGGVVATRTGWGILGFNATSLNPEDNGSAPWNTTDGIQLGNGTHVPAAVNETLPLSGTMNTGAAPLSFLNLNVSGSLEQAYDGVAVEWVPTDGEEPLRAPEFRFPTGAAAKVRPFVERACDPSEEASSLLGTAPIPVTTFERDFNCPSVPLGTELTSSHAGGQPGETTRALTGSPTLDVLGVENVDLQTAGADITAVTSRVVDRPTAQDWTDMGSMTVNLNADLLSRDVFWLPTATNLDRTVQHRLRVPITQGEWCGLVETAESAEPLRLTTQERRLFGADAWDVNVRLETGELTTATGRSLGARQPAAEQLTPFEDPSLTSWRTLEYELKLPPAVHQTTPGESFDTEYCENLDDHRDQAPGLGHPTDLTTAQLVFELTATESADEEALDVGWFLDEVQVQPLGIELTGDPAGHETKRCFTPDGDERPVAKNMVPTPDDASRSIQGCTTELTGNQRTGTLGHPTFSDLPSEEHLQRLSISGSSVTMANGDAVPLLENLQEKSEFVTVAADDENDNTDSVLYRETTSQENNEYDEPVDEVLRAPVPDDEDPERFRYMDTFTLVDLRGGLQGTFELDVTAIMRDGSTVQRTEDEGTGLGEHVVAQVVAAPVQPGDAAGEGAPARADWTPLEFCEGSNPVPVQPSRPDSPLGATDDSMIGPIDGPHTTLERRDSLCVELSRVGGEIAVIGLRFWIPLPDTGVEVGLAKVNADVVTPRTLEPRLRALTDDTVHEGTLTINEVELLSMPPRFRHAAQVSVSETETWTRRDGETVEVLPSKSAPQATVNVIEPALDSAWNVTVRVNATYDPEDPGDTSWVNGTVPLDQDRFEGSQAIELPWGDLRQPLDWMSDRPWLPANVTALTVTAATTPDELTEVPIDGCPADLEALASSQDRACRRLADIMRDDDQSRLEVPTEANSSSLPGGPGVRDLEVTPDRHEPGTPRTARLALANPSSQPERLGGTLVVETHDGDRVWRTDLPETLVDPWDRATTEISIPGFEKPNTRFVAEADVGDNVERGDFRTTTDHPTEMLDPDAFRSDENVERTPEAAQPPLAGEADDGLGWRIESPGRVREATRVITNGIDSDAIHEMLRDETARPTLSFQHQADLRDEVNDNPDDTSYLAVGVCPTDGGDSCNLLETGWNPEPQEERPVNRDGGHRPYDRCTESWPGDPDHEITREGVEAGLAGSDRVFRSSTGPIQPDTLTAWETAVVPIDDPDVIDASWDEVEFHIWLGECVARGPSQVLIDDVELGSARPVLDIGADEVPIRPGVEKRYRFTLSNEGGGSANITVAPHADLPDGWRVEASIDGSTLFETGETPTPVPLQVGERTDGVLRVDVPEDEAPANRTASLTAYVDEAPGLRSSGAVNASVAQDDVADREAWEENPLISTDPGRLKLRVRDG